MDELQNDVNGKRRAIFPFLFGMLAGAVITGFVSYKVFVPPVVSEEEYANEDVSEEIAALDAMVRKENSAAEARDAKNDGNTATVSNDDIPYIDLVSEKMPDAAGGEKDVADNGAKDAPQPGNDKAVAENNAFDETSVIETPEDTIIELRKKETLSAMLSRAGVEKNQLYKLTKAFSSKADVRRLRPGQKFILRMDNKGISFLSMESRDGTVVVVKRNDDDSFSASKNMLKLEKSTVSFEGKVDGSFSVSAAKVGMNSEQIKMFTQLYGDIVSFKKDVKNGDEFAAVFESMNSPSGRIVRDMKLVFASFTVRGNVISRYYYVGNDGFGDYYNEKGHSIRRFLNIRPVNAKKISSRFGSRFHPVLGRIGFHYGVDYAAKSGTPVYAAGDGVVTYVGGRGTYGNYVQIRHDHTYSTAYAHLNGFAKIKKGQRIKKGTLIGYVGSTGISTGPHLHFEVHKKGQKVDPLKQYAIAEKNLRGKELKKFYAFCEKVNPRYAKGKNIENAALAVDKNDTGKN